MELTITDYVVFAVIIVSMIASFVRGFSLEVLSLLGWVGAVYAAFIFGPNITPYVLEFVSVDWLATTIALGGVFIVVLISITLIANIFANFMQKSSIGALDHSLGLIFGGARGVLILVIAYFVILVMVAPEKMPRWITEAQTHPHLENGVITLVRAVPVEEIPFSLQNLETLLRQKLAEAGGEVIDKTLSNPPPAKNTNDIPTVQNPQTDNSRARDEINNLIRSLRQTK